MQKRGQVTVFIILGILILFTIISFLSVRSYLIKKQIELEAADKLELDAKTQSMQNFVESCIDVIGGRAIINLGYNGGRKKLIGPYFEDKFFDANYIYYLGEELAPSLKEMEISLGVMMEEHLNDCVQNFTPIRQVDVRSEIVDYNLIYGALDIEAGKAKASTTISEDFVLFNVEWPLKLKFKNMETEISYFPAQRFEVKLKKMNIFLENFAGKLKNQPYIIDTLYLLEQNYSIDVALFENDTYVFWIEDKNSVIKRQPLRFLFAGRVNTTGILV